MSRITPHLWFDKEAREAAEFYTSLFPNSKITSSITLHNTPSPSGDVESVSFEVSGQSFQALSAGPDFKINPSVSFFLNFDPSQDQNARENLDKTWEKLFEGGKALMPLQKYPFSEYYGWVEDRYGVSWQLILTSPAGDPRPFVVPSLLFVGEGAGKAEEAIDFYVSVFKNSKRGTTARYPSGQEPDKEGTLTFADFMLEGQWFAAMDSAHPHKFAFNEGVSLIVSCETQDEVDYYWEKLSAVPASEQCGWLKDKYGVSWQILPSALDKLLDTPDEAKKNRVTQAFLQMKKLEIAPLERAFQGK